MLFIKGKKLKQRIQIHKLIRILTLYRNNGGHFNENTKVHVDFYSH